MLREAGIPAISRGAFEAYCEPQRGGAVIAVSHEGGTWATVQAIQAARAAASATGLITARQESEATRHADAVLATPTVDRSWCHTVGYPHRSPPDSHWPGPRPARPPTPPRPGDGRRRPRFLGRGRDAAKNLHGCEQLLIVGSGADRTARAS